MRVLLDNCCPRQAVLAILSGHDAVHASRAGMSDLHDGPLLLAAEAAGFEVVVTVDRNLRFQQNLRTLPIPLVVIDVERNTAPFLATLVGPIREAVERAGSSTHGCFRVGSGGKVEAVPLGTE